MKKNITLLLAAIFLFNLCANAETIFLEAESFDNTGGWVIDTQAFDAIDSAYLLAHGIGVPVADAAANIDIKKPGLYRVWVRTRDWVAPWNAKGAPGKFKILIDDKPLKTTFGTEGANWNWQDGGTVNLEKGSKTITLHDLTGFDGRCDAIILTTNMSLLPPDGKELTEFRKKALHLDKGPENAGDFDLIVVGGGMAGSCAAISAARCGLKVALIQNRSVLTGNHSSEVRVHACGETNLGLYPRLGDVVNQIASPLFGNAAPKENYQDDKALGIVNAEKNITLFLNTHVFDVEKKADSIKAVIARRLTDSKNLRFSAPLFADCTGDAAVGFLADADFRYGRESTSLTKENMAPKEADKLVLGTSVLWNTAKTLKPASFPDCPWALQFDEQSCQHTTHGDWNWETGFDKNQIYDAEYIRDYLLRAIYGNWAFQKNHSAKKADYEKYALNWVAYVGGKRESRRLLGDIILTQQNIQQKKNFDDACVVTTWSIDLHYPMPKNSKHFPNNEFRSVCEQIKIEPYAIPYRCFYSRTINNLFMAGRDISVTHVALGTVRVMRTCGMMGEVVGMAASLCKQNNTTPRCVYKNHLTDLKKLMTKGVGLK
jgi:hypothetical protein